MPQEKSRIEAIRDYFMACPLLKEGRLNIDYLGEDPVEYSIDSMLVSNPIVKQYMDGSSLRQHPFVFVSQEIRSQQIVDQIEASGFYEKLSDWIEEQNNNDNLPDIPGAQRIEVMAPGYMYDATQTTAVYQIQCRVLYIKEV